MPLEASDDSSRVVTESSTDRAGIRMIAASNLVKSTTTVQPRFRAVA